MDFGGLLFARNDQRIPSILLQILCNRIEPFINRRRHSRRTTKPELGGQRPCEELNFRSAQRQMMICAGTSHAWRRLDHIEPTHFATEAIEFGKLVELAPARKLSGIPNVSRAAAQEIRIERKNDFRHFGAINRIHVAAESELRALEYPVTKGGFPLVPFCLRIKRQNRLNLRRESRRSDDSGENAECFARGGPERYRQRLRRVQKLRPGLDLPSFGDGLRAVGIVKVQDGSLRERVRRAQTRGMVGIALDLRRPPFMAFHQQTNRVSPKWHGGSIKPRLAQDNAVRLLDLGDDVLFRRPPATTKTLKSQRRSHQLQEIAPVYRFVPLRRRLTREFFVEQFLKVRIVRKLFKAAPILLPGFRLQLGAHRC